MVKVVCFGNNIADECRLALHRAVPMAKRDFGVGPNDGERCPKFVRGIRNEQALAGEGLINWDHRAAGQSTPRCLPGANRTDRQ